MSTQTTQTTHTNPEVVVVHDETIGEKASNIAHNVAEAASNAAHVVGEKLSEAYVATK